MRENKYAKHTLRGGLVLTMLFFLLCSGHGQETAREQDPLIFLVNERLVPIAYAENGIAKGVVVDIAKALGEKIERPIEIRAMDWLEAQAKVLAGQADALLQMNRNPAREGIFSFSSPLLQSEFVIFRRQGDPDIQGTADLQGKRVGLEAGGYAFDLLSGNDRIEKVFILSPAQGFELLKSEDLDALVLDRWIGEYELAKSRVSGIQIVREPLEISCSHIAVKKGNLQLLGLINSGLQEINDDGTRAQILDDWRGKNVIYFTEEQMRKTAVVTVMAMLLTISSFAIFFLVKFKKLNQDLEVKVVDRTQELAVVNERLESANTKLKKLSMLDQLTQIANRRGFDILFERAWGICQTAQRPLALIVLDIDRFKDVNDVYGHLTGDRYLKELAFLLQDAARRPGDAVARLGGDEFAAVLLNTTEDGAVQVAESMQAKIEDLNSTNEGVQTRFSASFGVAVLIPDQDMVSTELFALADQALYKAKESGRNRVVRASEI